MPAVLAATCAILALLSAVLLLWARYLQDGARIAAIAHADQARLLQARRLYAAAVMLLPLAALLAVLSAALAPRAPEPVTAAALPEAPRPADQEQAGQRSLPAQPPQTAVTAAATPGAAPAEAPPAVRGTDPSPEMPAPRYRVQMPDDGALLVRANPAGPVVGRIPAGSYVTASGLPPQRAQGRLWVEIETPIGVTGWVAAEFLGEAS